VLEPAIALLVVVLVAALLARFVISVVTVRDYQRGVRFRNGRLAGLLSTGTHVAIRPFSEIQILDGRPAALTVPRQAMLTADGVEIHVSLVARYVVVDPVTAVTGDQSWPDALSAALQVRLRQAVAERTVEEVLAARTALGATIAAAIASDVARIGVELLGVDVGEVLVPAELRNASVAIVAARREAEAAVERARGETAVVKTLADAGRLVDQNPAVLQLRAFQQAETTSARAASGTNGGSDGGAPLAAGDSEEAAENGVTTPTASRPVASSSGRARSRAAGGPTTRD
jgi:regulator of protease activity HflC (stomatin/prohibitin superfamily)